MDAHNQRLGRLDPLLAPAGALTVGTGTHIEVEGAAAVYRVIETDPDTLQATWNDLHRHALQQIRIGAADPASAMKRLLAVWSMRLDEAPLPADGDSAAVLSWPSRDAEVVKVLRESGFGPTATLAVRARDSLPGRPNPDVTVRPVEERDVDAVLSLQLDLMRWDDNFGGAHWRASTPARVQEYVAGLTGGDLPRAWVAELDGDVVGTCSVERGKDASWAGAAVAADPEEVAYIGTMSVAPGRRGGGIGTLLIAHVHHEMEAAGIRLPILHYAPLNPLSAPFWHRAGYRPLLTTWKMQPHNALRIE